MSRFPKNYPYFIITLKYTVFYNEIVKWDILSYFFNFLFLFSRVKRKFVIIIVDFVTHDFYL